jgi:hypothetical protein
MSQHIPTPSQGSIKLVSEGVFGGQDSEKATATCFCGTVQIIFVSDRACLSHD